MRKPDEAHTLTDRKLEELEKRIALEYKNASDELTDKINAYFESFKKRDAKQKELIGTIVNGREYTEKDYQQWRLAQIGRGKRFGALRDRVAERMTKANEVAAAYINDTTPGIYSLNRNYAAYTIERQVGADVGFDLWDEQTVKRLIIEQPDIMPYYPPKRAVKRGIDLAYGKRQITAQVTSSILQGESIKQIADHLQTNIPDMNRTSAVRAARTAVTGAQNAGRMDNYSQAEEMGIELEREWLATLDNRTRHAHRRDGKVSAKQVCRCSSVGKALEAKAPERETTPEVPVQPRKAAFNSLYTMHPDYLGESKLYGLMTSRTSLRRVPVEEFPVATQAFMPQSTRG